MPGLAVAGGLERQEPARALTLDRRNQVAAEIVPSRHVAGEERAPFGIAQRQRVDDRDEHVRKNGSVDLQQPFADAGRAFHIGPIAHALEVGERLVHERADVGWRLDGGQLARLYRDNGRREIPQRFFCCTYLRELSSAAQRTHDGRQCQRRVESVAVLARADVRQPCQLGRGSIHAVPSSLPLDHSRDCAVRCRNAGESFEQHTLGLHAFMFRLEAERGEERPDNPAGHLAAVPIGIG